MEPCGCKGPIAVSAISAGLDDSVSFNHAEIGGDDPGVGGLVEIAFAPRMRSRCACCRRPAARIDSL